MFMSSMKGSHTQDGHMLNKTLDNCSACLMLSFWTIRRTVIEQCNKQRPNNKKQNFINGEFEDIEEEDDNRKI